MPKQPAKPISQARAMAKSRTVSFDTRSKDFGTADAALGELIDQLVLPAVKLKNGVQILVELRSARQYLKAPKAKRDLLNELFIKPLKRIAKDKPSDKATDQAKYLLAWFAPY
jgi:hypothetical protein